MEPQESKYAVVHRRAFKSIPPTPVHMREAEPLIFRTRDCLTRGTAQPVLGRTSVFLEVLRRILALSPLAASRANTCILHRSGIPMPRFFRVDRPCLRLLEPQEPSPMERKVAHSRPARNILRDSTSEVSTRAATTPWKSLSLDCITFKAAVLS